MRLEKQRKAEDTQKSILASIKENQILTGHGQSERRVEQIRRASVFQKFFHWIFWKVYLFGGGGAAGIRVVRGTGGGGTAMRASIAEALAVWWTWEALAMSGFLAKS